MSSAGTAEASGEKKDISFLSWLSSFLISRKVDWILLLSRKAWLNFIHLVELHTLHTLICFNVFLAKLLELVPIILYSCFSVRIECMNGVNLQSTASVQIPVACLLLLFVEWLLIHFWLSSVTLTSSLDWLLSRSFQAPCSWGWPHWNQWDYFHWVQPSDTPKDFGVKAMITIWTNSWRINRARVERFQSPPR